MTDPQFEFIALSEEREFAHEAAQQDEQWEAFWDGWEDYRPLELAFAPR